MKLVEVSPGYLWIVVGALIQDVLTQDALYHPNLKQGVVWSPAIGVVMTKVTLVTMSRPCGMTLQMEPEMLPLVPSSGWMPRAAV